VLRLSRKLDSPGQLSVEDLEMLHSNSQAGAQVIYNILRMDKVDDDLFSGESHGRFGSVRGRSPIWNWFPWRAAYSRRPSILSGR
jgi:hypothetical protein